MTAMHNLVCFKHPQYRGVDSPVLSCKTCCSIFIAAVKEQNAALSTELSPADWLKGKEREAQKFESGGKPV